jgi:putative peptidoglycan lipid II flippase
MISPFRFLSRETRGMHQAAYILAAFALASQFIGLFRDRILAFEFGAGHTLDLYYAAFRVPDLLFATVASLFSIYALLPILSRLEQEQEGLMISFLRNTLWVFFAGMSFISLILYALAPVLAPLIAPGLATTAASSASLVLLMRILLLQPILLGASNTIASLTQLRHRFILYSISPLLYNLGIIFGAVVLYPRFGVAGLGWGVIFGAAMHVAVQLPYLFTEQSVQAAIHTGRSLSISRMTKGLKEVLVLSIPRTLALASTQISLVALTAMASILASGSITIFTFAYNLQSVPLTIIGVSYAVAAFPTLSRLHARGAAEEFLQYIEAALRHIIFWAIPATVFMIVLRAQIVRVILGTGQFNWNDTRLTAAALALFVISLAAQSITMLIARAYYAVGNTRKPLYYGCADVIVSISSGLLLLYLFHENAFLRAFIEAMLRVEDVPGTAILMLALGYALGSIAEGIISYYFFVRDFAVSRARLARLIFESTASSIIGSGVTYIILSTTGATGTINTTLGLIAQAILAGGIGLAVAAGTLLVLKNQEFGEALTALKRKFTVSTQVAVEPSDVS